MLVLVNDLVGLVVLDGAFIVQNQNLLLQISNNKKKLFLWYVCFNAFQKEDLRQNIEKYKLHHTDLWHEAFSEFADQHCYTQNITKTELHALTEMEGKSQSQQKKGQNSWKK